MKDYYLESALLADGWARDVVISVADDGDITAILGRTSGAVAPAATAERIAGCVVPGMANGHSHAFQRGMAGNTEYRVSAHDSFWTWREAMYSLANRIGPEDLQTLAAQLFIEMLKAGYTSVAEFHYLHRRPNGDAYSSGNDLWDAVAAAAATAGIALSFLPTLYQSSDFGAQSLKREQARFAMTTEEFLRGVQCRLSADRRSPHSPRGLRTGAAFHSLRAVPVAVLREAVAALRTMDPAIPLHIHVAEQTKEVDACVAHTGRRPIDLLMDLGLVDEHWCLVHATHASAVELGRVADAQATVCLSISTEANLGDGLFDAASFLKLGGRICVGSDSQASVCPAEELRWMEYQHRLREHRRSVLAEGEELHAGTRLWRDAALHGSQAIGQPAGVIAIGRRADWVVLDQDHPSMAGAPLQNVLDHLVFAGGSAAIRHVMVAGRWVIRDGLHTAEPGLRDAFTALMKKLAGPGLS